MMYSLIETAKENGLNPYDYLVSVFKLAPKMELSQNPGLVEQLIPEVKSLRGEKMYRKLLTKQFFRDHPYMENSVQRFVYSTLSYKNLEQVATEILLDRMEV